MQRASVLVKGLGVALAGTIVFAECLPTVNTTFDVNGIVVGVGSVPGAIPPGSCVPDSGWGGVTANTFVPVNGMMDTHVSRMFFVGRAAGPNLDRIFVGIHVENDDGFSSNDILTLYIDANNSASFDAGDFAAKIEMGPGAPATSELCKQAANNITYYTFGAGSWNVTPLPANGVSVATSHDYNAEMPDPESGLWEVEIEIRPSALGITMPAATGLKIGAKLYVDEPGIGTRVLAFPAGLTTNDDPNATSPNDGAVTANKLSTLTVGTCAFDVQLVSIEGVDAFGNTSRFTRFPNPISGTLPVANRNKFKAEVKFVNPANAADMSAVAVPNSGKITFRVFPWAGGFVGDFLMGTASTAFTNLGQVKPVQVTWPENEAQYKDARAALEQAALHPGGHVCLKASLSDFAVNLNESSDIQQQNLFFTPLSTIKDSFVIQGRRQEGPGGVTLYYLKARWNNLPPKVIADPTKPARGLWNYRFPNASQIGLKHVGKGWWAIALKPNQQERVELELTGAGMPTAASEYTLSPRAGGAAVQPRSGERPLSVAVKPGMIVTIVANGLVGVERDIKRRPLNGPNGFVDRDMAERPFLLHKEGAFAGWENVGALIGSFDNFRTSFVIGGARTFMVPEKATRLSLAVNDVAGRYGDNTGKGFRVTVVLTAPMFLPTRLASPGNPGNGLPVIAAPGANLPQFNVDLLEFEEQRKLLRPAGYVAYAVYNSHRQ